MTAMKVLMGLLAFPTGLFAQNIPCYSVKGFASLASTGAVLDPLRINNVGEVVGYGEADKSPALFWQHGQTSEVPLGQFDFACASGINNAGTVVGDTFTSGLGEQAIAYANGHVTYLTAPNTGSAAANAVNDSGTIAGTATVNNGFNAVTWTNGKMTDLDPSTTQESEAVAINNHGVVAGYVGDEPNADTHLQPVIWQNGKMTYLGAADFYGTPRDINDAGVVVGENVVDDNSRAFSWYQGQLKELGFLSGDNGAVAEGINAAGTIVGFSVGGSSVPEATLWEGSSIVNLNSLLPVNSGWDLQQAMDINDLGQIVGIGTLDGQTAGFLLTPGLTATPIAEYGSVPTPTAGALAALLAPGLLCMRVRGRRFSA